MTKLEVQTLPDKLSEKKDEVPYFFPRAAFVTIPPVDDISVIVSNYDNPEVFDSKPKRHDLAPDSISLINRIPSTDLAKEAVRVSLNAHTGHSDGKAPPPSKSEAEALFKAYEDVYKDYSTLFSSKKIYADELALELYPIAVILLWRGV